MYENEHKTREMYEELERRQKDRDNSVLRKIPDNSRYWFIGALGLVVVLTYIGKISQKNGIVLGLVIAGIMYFSANSMGGTDRPLTEEECRARLYQQLKNKQMYAYGQYYQIHPRIKIKQEPQCKLRFLEGEAWKWVLGVSFYDPESYIRKYYAAICNPYSGGLQGMIELKGGMSELEINDVSLIPDYKMYTEKKYHDYMGKYWDNKGGG